jgi:hypothetical protein
VIPPLHVLDGWRDRLAIGSTATWTQSVGLVSKKNLHEISDDKLIIHDQRLEIF